MAQDPMPDHPLYAMWKARYDADLGTQRERAAMRADREAKRAAWRETWRAYLTRGAAEHLRCPAAALVEPTGMVETSTGLTPTWHMRLSSFAGPASTRAMAALTHGQDNYMAMNTSRS